MTCPLDSIALADHARCQRCGLLVGAAHYAKRGHSQAGALLCDDCATRPPTGSTWACHAPTPPDAPPLPPGVTRQRGGHYRAFVSRGQQRLVIGNYHDSALAGRAAAAGRAARDAGLSDAAIVQAGREAE